MRHGNRKKRIGLTVCMALMSGVIGGCGKGGSGTGSLAEQAKGRYVETQVQLPGQLEGWSIRQIFAAEDEVHLLAVKQEDGKTALREWARQGDEFADVTQEWLEKLELYCGEWLEVQLMQDAEGIQYLFAGYVAEGEEDYKGHLWRGEDEEARDITPQKWTVPDESWGIYEYVHGAAVLDNGSLMTISYTSIDIVYGEDGSVLESEPICGMYGDDVVTDGENIYLYTSSDSGFEIEKRKGGKSSDAVTLRFPQQSSGISICALKDSTLIAGCGDGIFRCGPGETDWERLLAGAETDFALTDCWCIGMAALEDGRIYALFQESGDIVKLNEYKYDPDAVIEVTQELKLYTVYESYLLQQAAVMYHKEHPDILITIEYAYPRYYYGETDYNAVYQSLNTMLMGEVAPDIVVMDHLNMDAYVSKGLLVDINDVVSAMEESGELLSNITGAYVQEDGSRYIVPLQFGFCLAVGRDIAVEDMGSLEALADFLSGSDYSYLGSQTVSELVDKFYPYFCTDIVVGKELDKETLGKYLEYLKKIGDNCGMIGSRGKEESCYNMWDLASEAKLAFEEADGFKGSMFPMAIVDYIQGEFTAFEHSFVPSVQTGICAKSEYIDTAKDFLRFALTRDIQDTDYYSGFPVNLASLEKQAYEDRSDAEAETAIVADGGYEVFKILDYPHETADKLIGLCKTLDKPVKEDAKIREVLIKALEGYLNGTQSEEETVEKIEGGLKMYLAE